MKLFLFIIGTVWVVVIPLNHFFLFGTELLWLNLLGIVGGTVLMIALDGSVSSLVHKNRNRLNPFSKFFSVTKEQKNVLQKFGVKHFKRFMPDLGSLVKFPKNKILDPKSPEYIFCYLIESCAGELGHWISAFAGLFYIAVFVFQPIYCLALGFPVAITNFALMLMPSLTLRFNRYSLEQIYKKLSMRKSVD